MDKNILEEKSEESIKEEIIENKESKIISLNETISVKPLKELEEQTGTKKENWTNQRTNEN